jgi:uncharacterized membrane protein
MSFHYLLKSIGIDSIALKATYADLQNKLPKPILVHVSTNTPYFLLADKADEEYVYVVNINNKPDKISREQFLMMWKGACMIIDTENVPQVEESTLDKVKSALAFIKKPFIIISFFLLLLYLFLTPISSRNYINVFYLIFYAAGIFFSGLLVWNSIDEKNLLVKKICTSGSGNAKVNCSSILDSKDAYFLGLFSWSDIGFVFMATLFMICLLLPASLSNSIACLTSIPAFIYVFYSIYYQKFVARNWCRLCLGVQAVLLLLLLLSLWNLSAVSFSEIFSFDLILKVILISIVVISAFIFLKSLLFRFATYPRVQRELLVLKHYAPVKEILYKNQKFVKTDDVFSIEVNKNDNASNELLLVFSPVCNPCLNELKELFSFLKTKTDLKFKIVFFLDKEKFPSSYIIAKNMLDVYLKFPAGFFDYLENYVMKYPVSANNYSINNPDNEEIDNILSKQDKWCKANKFSGTPIIIFNQRLLNPMYSIKDLDFICE